MTKKENSTQNESIPTEATAKIDAIKQLIFGENMQAYDTEFEAIKQDLFDKKLELENIIEEIKSELLQNIDNLSTDINIRISDLEQTVTDKIDTLDEQKVDKKLLGDLLKTLGEKISQ